MLTPISTDITGRHHLATPRSGSGAGVLVLHPWWGLTDPIRHVCDRLAAEGFVALAPDLYHGRTAKTVEDAEALMKTLQAAQVERDLAAALEKLRAQPRVTDHRLGLVGFSLGASYAIKLAGERGADIGAVVLYYGTGDADYAKTRAAFLGHFAETDPYEDMSWVRKFEQGLRAANLDVEFHVYPGTGHWFFEEDRRDAYNPEDARLSWERTIAFLKKHLR